MKNPWHNSKTTSASHCMEPRNRKTDFSLFISPSAEKQKVWSVFWGGGVEHEFMCLCHVCLNYSFQYFTNRDLNFVIHSLWFWVWCHFLSGVLALYISCFNFISGISHTNKGSVAFTCSVLKLWLNLKLNRSQWRQSHSKVDHLPSHLFINISVFQVSVF